MNNEQVKKMALGILIEGRRRFDAMLGIVSRIKDGQYTIFAVSSDTGIPEVGDVYPLTAVYCRDVYQSERTVAITEIDGVPGMRLHPLYDTIPCEFYISSPIFVDGKVWGTLNFTSLVRRAIPFSSDDIAHNEADAMKISSAIAATGLG
jgi:GAF domain-containing protein